MQQQVYQVPKGAARAVRIPVERRRVTRVCAPFHVTVRGASEDGTRFERRTVVDNLSAGGLYARLVGRFAPGMRLFALVWFSPSQGDAGRRPCLAVRAVVLRAEPKPGGVCGLAVHITHHRFI